MCTAATYKTKDFYFGRTLDYEFSYGEEVVITPRNYVFNFKKEEKIDNHYAIIGMAHVIDNYPLYFDASNEEGLGIAGLNFDGPCHYFPEVSGKNNVTPFELIPYLLSQYTTVAEVKEALKSVSPFLPFAK